MKRSLKGLAVLSMIAGIVPANATIARLKALGMNETDNEGSYYIQDNRNIFLNAAAINDFKDTLILEWGGNGADFGSASLQTDKDGNPKAKGGFLKSYGSGVYGVYLGNESNTASLLRGVGTGATSADNSLAASVGGSGLDQMLDGADNQIDLFYGQSSSIGDWGVNFVYAEGKNAANRARNIAHAVRLGLKNNGWQAFANISTGTKVNQVDSGSFHQFEGKLGFHLGGSYDVVKTEKYTGTVYGFAKKFDWEQTDSAGATGAAVGTVVTNPALGGLSGLSRNNRGQAGTADGGFLTYALGYGTTYKSGKGTLYTNIEYRHKEIEVKFTTKPEAKNVIVPVQVAYEYGATSWLTLRGSVSHNLMGYRENNNYGSLNLFGNVAAIQEFGADTGGKKVDISNSTDVRAGATLKLGKVDIDGLIGVGGSTGTVTADPTERGVLDMDRLLARVGMTYSF